MLVNYVELNTGQKERVFSTDVSDTMILQIRSMLPEAVDGVCEMLYGTGFHLEMFPGGYRAFLYDMRAEKPVLMAVSEGAMDSGARLKVWKELTRQGNFNFSQDDGKILEMPPAVPFIADCLTSAGEARPELDEWRKNFTQGLGWTIFLFCSVR